MPRSSPAAALALGVALLAPLAPAAAKEKLVPARYQSHNDGLGQDWTVDSRGSIQVNQVGQVLQLQVNGNQFNPNTQQMTEDGREFVFDGRCGAIQVTRRARVQEKLAGCRVVDVIDNPSARPLALTLTLTSRMNMMPGSAPQSDQGQSLNGNFGKKERGLYVQTAANVTVFFGVAGRRGKLKPTLSQRHNYELTLSYTVKVPPKSQVALIYAVAKTNGVPSPKQRDDVFADFVKSRFTKDLPAEVRGKLINSGRGLGPEASATLATLEDELGIAGATLDLLAFGQDTRVRGTAHCEALTVRSRFGESAVPFEKVAALAGEAYAGGARVHLKDGQKLTGSLVARGLRFEMTTGLAVDLEPARLDRLVLRKQPDELNAAPSGRLLVETSGGDRLLMEADPETQLALATRWGLRRVPLGRVQSLVRAEEGETGFWVALKDKSRFRAFFAASELSFRSVSFGAITLQASEVLSIFSSEAVAAPSGETEEESEVLQPHLILSGGDLLVGQVDLPALHFAGNGAALPVPPTQIRSLTNGLEGETPEFSEGLPFRAELWGGGEVSGVLSEALLPVQTGDGKLFVPAREVLQVSVPTPQIPPALRERIATLIRQLGDPSWQKREGASRELQTLGALARLPLEEARDQTRDPEVERRVRALLAGLEDE